MSQGLLAQEGYNLMGAAFEVYNELGSGLLEAIYQESLEIELNLKNIPFKSKQELAVYYKGRELQCRYVPDLFVYEKIVVELKAAQQLAPEHAAQILNYMYISGTPVGYLIDFGKKDELEWKRYILDGTRGNRTTAGDFNH